MKPVFPWSMSDFKPGERILCAEADESGCPCLPNGQGDRILAYFCLPLYTGHLANPELAGASCRFFHGEGGNTRHCVWF